MSHPKVANTDHDIHELIQHRWSPRAYDSSRPVPRTELMRLFEAARWAPSSRNEQPWRFLVLDRVAAPEQWRKLFDTLTTSNQTWAAAAPVLVLAAVRTSFEDTGTANAMSWYDAGQAVALLTIQATSQGLSIRQMEGFDRVRAREAFGIPAEFEPGVAIAIGYAGDPDVLSIDKHKVAETQPRKRRPLGDFVYEGSWSRP
ncbi:MAG TPA: nitroreductase family protein [Vicinamibacterales bacterium]|nr:nitroreductase family protein [Vicinamibacterales bacterium]